MTEIESVFVDESPLNVSLGQFKLSGDGTKVKIGEIFQFKDGSQAMNCTRCFQEFQYFSEFSLHIEEHYLKGDIPKPDNIVKAEGKQIAKENDTNVNMKESTCKVEPAISITQHESDNDSISDDDDDNFDNGGQYVESNWSDESSAESANQNSSPKYPLCSKPFANISYVRKHIYRFHKQKYSAAQIKNAQKKRIEISASTNQEKKDSVDEAMVDSDEAALSDFDASNENDSIDSNPEPKRSDEGQEELVSGVHYQKVDQMYKCLTCNRVLSKFFKFKEHHQTHSGTKNVFCPLCKKTFLSVSYVRKHIWRYHKRKMSGDAIKDAQNNCGMLSSKSTSLCEKEQSQCSISADIELESQQETQIATIKLNEIQTFECFVCRRQMKLWKSLKAHMKLHVFTCPIPECNQNFPSKRYVSEHLANVHDFKSHTQHAPIADLDQSHKCSRCEKTFSTKRYLQKHLSRMHPSVIQELLCPICGSVLKSRDSFRRHMQLHDADSRHSFKCDSCDKTFSTRRYMVRLEKRFNCI